jgi:hypothetical protein
MISYEVVIGLIILMVVLLSNSMNLTSIIEAQNSIWYVIPLAPIAFIFFITALAETNRAPFDLPEAVFTIWSHKRKITICWNTLLSISNAPSVRVYTGQPAGNLKSINGKIFDPTL